MVLWKSVPFLPVCYLVMWKWSILVTLGMLLTTCFILELVSGVSFTQVICLGKMLVATNLCFFPFATWFCESEIHPFHHLLFHGSLKISFRFWLNWLKLLNCSLITLMCWTFVKLLKLLIWLRVSSCLGRWVSDWFIIWLDFLGSGKDGK